MRDTLYSYTRQHLRQWLAAGGPDVASVIADTAKLADCAGAGPAEVEEILVSWLDSDVKAQPLKTAQGLICAAGFRAGDLHGEFFADVAPALTAWHDADIALYVFSSGSVQNQKDWFAYARGGELSSLIRGWFDLNSAGVKEDSLSYEKIADAIGVSARQILFLSDHAGELDAAAKAGWEVLGVSRPGEPYSPRAPHRWIESFTEIKPAEYGSPNA